MLDSFFGKVRGNGARASRDIAANDVVGSFSPFAAAPAAVRGVAAAAPVYRSLGSLEGPFVGAAPLRASAFTAAEDAPPPPTMPRLFNAALNSSFTVSARSGTAVEEGLAAASASLRSRGVECGATPGLPSISLLAEKAEGSAFHRNDFKWTVRARRAADGVTTTAWVSVFTAAGAGKGEAASFFVNVQRGDGDGALFYEVHRAIESHVMSTAAGCFAIPPPAAIGGFNGKFGARPRLVPSSFA